MLRRWGGILLLLFLVLRLGLAGVIRRTPEGGILIDSRGYLALATTLGQTGAYVQSDGQDLIWPPGYPGYIWLVSLGVGHLSPMRVALTQLALTALACLVLVAVGTRLHSPQAGLAAGWLYALSPNVSLWSLTVMSETLFAFLLTLALYAWVRYMLGGRAAWLAGAGVALGLSAWVRPIGLYLIVLWALVTLGAQLRASGLRRAVASSGLIVLSALGVILPWTARNWVVHGQPVFSTVSQKTFYAFNIAAVMSAAQGISRDQAVAALDQTGDPWQASLTVIRQYPLEFLRQQARGVWRGAVGVESGVWARLFGYGLERQGALDLLGPLLQGRLSAFRDNLRTQLSDPETVLLLTLAVLAAVHTVGQYALASVALFGWRQTARPAPAVILLAGLTVVYLIASPGAASQARFRIAAEPMLAALAGLGWGLMPRLRRGAPAPAGEAV